MGKRLILLAALVAVASLIILIALVVPFEQQQAIRSETQSTGTCSMLNESASKTIITCRVGERIGGFKLLKVGMLSAQILVYDDCGACVHTSSNENQFLKVIDINVYQRFGSPCWGIYPTELLSTDVINGSATFESNMSGEMYCI
ncbi:MAG: hypothetical protein KGI06_04200 [Candidatus Micrarchaeota archaeon]|nr:hypothetical protein [Candidatus Micrarchaeota archaeon]